MGFCKFTYYVNLQNPIERRLLCLCRWTYITGKLGGGFSWPLLGDDSLLIWFLFYFLFVRYSQVRFYLLERVEFQATSGWIMEDKMGPSWVWREKICMCWNIKLTTVGFACGLGKNTKKLIMCMIYDEMFTDTFSLLVSKHCSIDVLFYRQASEFCVLWKIVQYTDVQPWNK